MSGSTIFEYYILYLNYSVSQSVGGRGGGGGEIYMVSIITLNMLILAYLLC